MTGEEPGDALATYVRPRRLPAEVVRFAERLVRGAWERRVELDGLVGESSEHWKVERMPVVDRNLLRLGAYELLHPEDAPPAVVINEAVELAKRYGDADSGAFVNGVLDRLRRRLEEGPETVGTGPPDGGR